MKISEEELRRPLRLKGVVQPYSWGKEGRDSIISRLSRAPSSGHLAELWFGSHPKGPSSVHLGNVECSLRELISSYPQQILGKRVVAEFGPELPFLFKVLSIARPLSIQAHPDKALAAILHAKDPKNYPDSNHKPEIAIAINDVEILCGFRSVSEIQRNIAAVPELRALLGLDLSNRLLSWREKEEMFLRELYSAIVFAKADLLKQQSQALITRLKGSKELSAEDSWVLFCADDYADGDIGLFSFYILNLIRLSPGQMISTGPNTPHAYLSGELLECMANSDNVVRAGLTNKYKDQSTLISMLEYASLLPNVMNFVALGDSPGLGQIREFQVRSIAQSSQYEDIGSEGDVNLLFNLEGECKLRYSEAEIQLEPGDAYLMPALLNKYQVMARGKAYLVSVPRLDSVRA